MSEIPPREAQQVWLKHYFDEMETSEKDQESLIKDYLDGIEMMIPLAILHMLLAALFIGQIGTGPQVRLIKFAKFLTPFFRPVQTSLQNLTP